MVIRLGIITTKFYKEYFRDLCKEYENDCSFRIFTIDNLRKIKDIYLDNKFSLDGFIVTSKFLYDSIGEDYIDPFVPVQVLYEDEAIIYKGLFRLLLDNPQLDLTRVYMDFADVIDSFEEFRGHVSGAGKKIEGDDIFLGTETMLDNHLTLWREKKTDLSVTAFSHFVPELEKNHVKYVLISSRFNNVKQVINDLINQVTVIKLKARRTVVASLSFYENNNDITLNALYDLTRQFLSEHGIQDTAQIIRDHVSFFTTNENFMRITSDITNCGLLSYITAQNGNEINIGWGSGYDYVQAEANAEKANRQAAAYSGSCSFYIDEEQRVVGPLQNADNIPFLEQADPRVLSLARDIGINNINLQKIVFFLESRRTNKVSSMDIASCLGVTRRGANRILNRIEQNGYAQALFEKRDNNKGRPQKYYELTFLNNDGVME